MRPRKGDFVQTFLGKGFVKETLGTDCLVKHGNCRFWFNSKEVKVLQTREDRQKNGPLSPQKLKAAQRDFFKGFNGTILTNKP